MPSAYFVSDIHIQSPECPRARLFEHFLKNLSSQPNVMHLFLLGDIFDLWIADHRYFIDRYRVIVGEIRRLKSAGVNIIYFEGNHDLHLQYFWADQLGMVVHKGPTYFQLGDRTLRVEHGDQMDPDDRGYRFLRWFLRTPPIRWLICNLPGALIARIGERASSGSREYTTHTKSITADGAIAKIRSHARRAFVERPFDIILSGHVHIRDDHRIDTDGNSFRTVNLGSWIDAPCYFKLDGSEGRFYELTNA
jgi:UDP-2,3-diacylglucosamine hydrolase